MIAERLRLLPDEDPAVDDPRVIEHWITVYESRLAIGRLRLDSAAEGRAGESDLGFLEDRIGFWRRRHGEVTGLAWATAHDGVVIGSTTTITLSHREAQLLRFMAAHPGRFYTASALVAQAWSGGRLSDEQLRTYVGRLRRKLSSAGTLATIVARRSEGYALK
jgi:hypothetical protein